MYETFVTAFDIQIPRLNENSSDTEQKKTIEEEGYVDVGKTSAKTINDIYKEQSEFITDDDLPF